MHIRGYDRRASSPKTAMDLEKKHLVSLILDTSDIDRHCSVNIQVAKGLPSPFGAR